MDIISGIIELTEKKGTATFTFSNHVVTGDARLIEVRGPRNNLRGVAHAIISPSALTLSTNDNTRYKIDRSITASFLRFDWDIDRAGTPLRIDFLALSDAT